VNKERQGKKNNVKAKQLKIRENREHKTPVK
jgi:hypothetical protein